MASILSSFTLTCLMLSGCNAGAKAGKHTAVVPNTSSIVVVTQSDLPIRSLLPEIDQAKFGAAANVRTPFAQGSGLVLPESQEVLAHLHVVLTPQKQIASPISVNLSLSPLKKEKNRPAFVIAQDPAHDLVLLKVGRQPISANGGAGDAPSGPGAHSRPRRRYRVRHRGAASGKNQDASENPPSDADTKHPPPVKTHVVFDGPEPNSQESQDKQDPNNPNF